MPVPCVCVNGECEDFGVRSIRQGASIEETDRPGESRFIEDKTTSGISSDGSADCRLGEDNKTMGGVGASDRSDERDVEENPRGRGIDATNGGSVKCRESDEDEVAVTWFLLRYL